MDYVSHVLPALGEEAVEQRAVSELLDGIEVGREEAPDVARLKADTRIAAVVQRAVELAVKPAPEELVLYADGSFITVKERQVTELLDAATAVESRARTGARALPHVAPAPLLRAIRRAARADGHTQLRRHRARAAAQRIPDEVPRPVSSCCRGEKLVARPLTSPAALAEAAEGILERASEQRLLLRDRPRRVSDLRWSEHDLPLLDEARIVRYLLRTGT